VFCQKGLEHRPAAFVDRHADYGKSFAPVGFLELDEPGDLLFTAGAPGRPEIQKDDFAAVFLQVYGFALGVLQGEGGDRLPLFDWP
jgi:hypothetical protein